MKSSLSCLYSHALDYSLVINYLNSLTSLTVCLDPVTNLYVHMCACVYILHVYVCVCTCECVRVNVCAYECMCIYVDVCTCECVHVHMYAPTFVLPTLTYFPEPSMMALCHHASPSSLTYLHAYMCVFPPPPIPLFKGWFIH